MASVSEPVTFREFCPLYYLLNAIPTKIQKGFRSLVVYLTALDTNGDYIAVGSSIGMLYLYCRRHDQMKKYNFEGKTESITVVKLLSCFDDLVAAGTASGRVAVFQLVSSLPGRNKQLRRFDVTGIHKNSITALAWSPNGMKLFSGDDKGKIVYSSLDLDQGVCHSHLVLEEPASIVQLDYSQKVLLVSTLQRSLLFYTEERSVQQVGTQPRKSLQKAGWATPGLTTASSAWRSPRSISGAWTTKAACSAVRCQALGCAGRSSKMPSSRWQSRPQAPSFGRLNRSLTEPLRVEK
uniref:Tectonin beta-propeller repeat containing 2 n=1 Tax=Moschus moschiferus TaxID=68415 RepID=A0A8C6DN59_MOSMO